MKTGITIFVLLFSPLLHAQDYPLEQWIKSLGTDDKEQSFRLSNLVAEVKKYDSAAQQKIVRLVAEKVQQQKSKFLQVRFNMFREFALHEFLPRGSDYPLMNELKQSLAIAKELNNEMLLADVCYWYAGIMNDQQKTAEGLFYNLKSIELAEKLGPEKFFDLSHRYNILGELLYHTREYESSIEFSKKAIYNTTDTTFYLWKMFTHNTIGLAYKKLKQYDSAVYYFDKTARLAGGNIADIWVTIPSANKAQIWFEQKKYKEARPFFEADYAASIKVNDQPNAANNLQWLAKIYLAENKPDSALHKAKQALQLLHQSPQAGYFANTYQTLAAIYQQQNRTDSSNKYMQLYNHIHDSIEVVIAGSRSEIVKLRLDDERNRSKITLLEKEKQNEKTKRNAFIAVLLLLGLVAYLFYNRQRIKQRQQQMMKDAELKAAREQMQLFTKTITEKIELIDGLQQQVDQYNLDPVVQQNLEMLKHKTILTEDDWSNFQNLFEKIYPHFFERLKTKSPVITNAELRYAAIIRLQMNNQQAGAMLGISTDSARKTKLRLRQRLNLNEEANLEQFILNL